jgi:hypothetical protein
MWTRMTDAMRREATANKGAMASSEWVGRLPRTAPIYYRIRRPRGGCFPTRQAVSQDTATAPLARRLYFLNAREVPLFLTALLLSGAISSLPFWSTGVRSHRVDGFILTPSRPAAAPALIVETGCNLGGWCPRLRRVS